MSASRLLYRLLLTVAALPLLMLFIFQGWKNGVRRYPKERLGFISGRSETQKSIWFHAASVGEVNAIIPLLKAFNTTHPEQAILLTTTTISGFKSAQQRIPEIEHHFLPFDFHHAVRRSLRHLQPKILFVVETEIWPTLFRECSRQGIPIAIINGRLSQKSLTSPAWVRQLYRDALKDLSAIATRSDSDREHFIALGANSDRCQNLGNIKYAASLKADNPPSIAAITQINRPTVVAASTRDGEEQIIAASWRAARTDNHLLVIVPRHPERLISILKDLANYHIAIRSRGELPTDKTEIYLADTFGELKSFMSHSELVIMGGSFVAKGGQNLIEPAAMGRAIIVGSHMENFAEETRELLAQKAIVQVAGDRQLSQNISELLQNSHERERLGVQAEQFVVSHAGVIERYMAFVEESITAHN